MPKPLVIVESPAKARTIAGYLGADYVVESSVGHIRDLPSNASEVPKKFKGTDAGRLGIDVENHFQPIYVCLLYTSPSPRDRQKSRMPSSA